MGCSFCRDRGTEQVGFSSEMGEVWLSHTLGKLGENEGSLDKGGRNLRGP